MRRLLLATLVAALTLATFGVGAAAAAPAQGGGLDARVDTTNCDNGSKKAFLIEYNDGGIDSGCADGNVVDRSDIPNLLARELHVSCSDKFVGTGTTGKSDLGDPNRSVTSYSIWELKKGEVKKLKCGAAGGAGGGLDLLDGRIDTTNCDNDSKKAFLIEYSDSDVVGVDSGCADGNVVDRSDIPDLIARELHVSCSDDFVGTGTTGKSDLGDPNRSVVAYSIWEIKNGQIEKLKCGDGTPIPGGGLAGMAVVAAALGGVVLYGTRRTRATIAA